MVEYMVVVCFFMIVLWFAIVGVEPISENTGTPGTGRPVDRALADNPEYAAPYLGVRHAVREKEQTFRERIALP
jgi:hypothetical protein